MILDEILEETRRRLAAAKRRRPIERLEREAAAAPAPRDFAAALRRRPIACIAEFKRRSPSAGWIHEHAEPAAVARAYERAGAAALSVLTEERFFAGHLEDLRRAREAASLPVLRKDFTLDPYQVVEARAAGADAVLLVVAVLRDDELAGLIAEARRWGLESLVEAHDAREVARAVLAGARVVGINHRDLHRFTVDMDLAVRLRDQVPSDRLVVAESGIRTSADVTRMRQAGIDAILVGENLMRTPDPGAALAALLA